MFFLNKKQEFNLTLQRACNNKLEDLADKKDYLKLPHYLSLSYDWFDCDGDYDWFDDRLVDCLNPDFTINLDKFEIFIDNRIDLSKFRWIKKDRLIAIIDFVRNCSMSYLTEMSSHATRDADVKEKKDLYKDGHLNPKYVQRSDALVALLKLLSENRLSELLEKDFIIMGIDRKAHEVWYTLTWK